MRALWSLAIACLVSAGGVQPSVADQPDQPALQAQSHAVPAAPAFRHPPQRQLPVATLPAVTVWQPPAAEILLGCDVAPERVCTSYVATRSSRGPPIS